MASISSVNLDDLRDGALRALAVAQRRVDELELELRRRTTLFHEILRQTADRAIELFSEQLMTLGRVLETEMHANAPTRSGNEHATVLVPLQLNYPTAAVMPAVSVAAKATNFFLSDAYEAGARAGFEAGLTIGGNREEQILGELRVLGAARDTLWAELDATRSAMVEESSTLRGQYARAVDRLRRERLDRKNCDEARESALEAASAAAGRLSELRVAVEVAKARDNAFRVHAHALNEAMRAMAQRHAVALSHAIEAAEVASRRSQKARDADIATKAVKALRARPDRTSLTKAVAAVDRLCDDLDQRHQPHVSSPAARVSTPKHSYLKRAAARPRNTKYTSSVSLDASRERRRPHAVDDIQPPRCRRGAPEPMSPPPQDSPVTVCQLRGPLAF